MKKLLFLWFMLWSMTSYATTAIGPFSAYATSSGTSGAYTPFSFEYSYTPSADTTQETNGITSTIVYSGTYNELSGGWLAPITASNIMAGSGLLDKTVGIVSQTDITAGAINSAVGVESEIIGIATGSYINQYSAFYVPNLNGVANMGNIQKYVGYDMEDLTSNNYVVGFLSNVSYGTNKYAFLGEGTALSLFNGPVEFAAGEIGTVTGTAALQSEVGEVISGTNPPPGVSLTSGTATNILSINLSAGDWRCYGVVGFHPSSATSVTNYSSGESPTSGTYYSLGTYTSHSFAAMVPGTAPDEIINLPYMQINIPGPGTLYLIGSSVFTGGTMNEYGTMQCTRIR